MKYTDINGLEVHVVYVSHMNGSRFRVEFNPDTVVYFSEAELPKTIKYAIASRGNKLHPVISLPLIANSVEIGFSESEINQLMKDVGVGPK